MADQGPPQRVLTEALLEELGDAEVRAALFLTYQLEPPFFEDHILAPLLGIEQRGNPRVRRVMLEERLREMSEVLVLFDRDGLVPEGPLRQSVRAIPVDWSKGVQHAKHVLLLIDGALIVLTASANLTRSGWWENVEVADIERVTGNSSLRDDLLRLLDRMVELGAEASSATIVAMRTFLNGVRQSSGLPRLWLGAQPLDEFLSGALPKPLTRLEVLAPFTEGHAAPVARLHRTLAPRELVAWVPKDRTEQVAATQGWLDGVRALPGAHLGTLGLDRSLGKSADSLRFVHAKVIRATDGHNTWLLAGSPNLSERAHAGAWSGAGHANIETAILRSERGSDRWLEPLAKQEKVTAAPQLADSEDEPRGHTLPVRIRFDWASQTASARADRSRSVLVGPGTQDPAQPKVLLDLDLNDDWRSIPAAPIQQALATSNVLTVWEAGGTPLPILVEEQGAAHRPSMVAKDLTAADILQHWALLTPAQRARHTEELLQSSDGILDEEHGPIRATPLKATSGQTMFHAFAGVLHAFLMLHQRLIQALEKGQQSLVEHLVLGTRHDSLITLLRSLEEDEHADPVYRLVTLLSAKELVEDMKARCPDLWHSQERSAATLDQTLSQQDSLWSELKIEPAFEEWYQAEWSRGGEA